MKNSKETFGNKTIDNLPKKYKKMILSISDERSSGDGFWIYLEKPYLWDNEVGIVHEETIAEAISELKHSVALPR